jgi:hypothetical protein
MVVNRGTFNNHVLVNYQMPPKRRFSPSPLTKLKRHHALLEFKAQRKKSGIHNTYQLEGGVPLGKLIRLGFRARVLLNAGYSVQDLFRAGYPLREFVNGDFNFLDLVEVVRNSPLARKYSFDQDSWTNERINTIRALRAAGFSNGKLYPAFEHLPVSLRRRAGFTVADMLDGGTYAPKLVKGGYTKNDFRKADLKLSDIAEGCDLRYLVRAGYSGRELVEVGFPLEKVKEAIRQKHVKLDLE